MPGLGRRLASVSCGAAVMVLTIVGRSYAGGGGLQRCLDQQHPATTPTATGRLEELKTLLDRGLGTQAEYDERRQAIIDSV